MRTSKSYRIIIVQDSEPYEHGDYENDEERAEVEEKIESEGLWGYVVEKRVKGAWETIDSCFGFIGCDIDNNGMADYINGSIPAGYDILVHDEVTAKCENGSYITVHSK